MPTKTEYREYIASDKWQKRRQEFLALYNECTHCGIPRWLAVIAYDQDMHVDHVSYARVGAELDDDLQPLCKRCHEIKHFKTSSLHQVKKMDCPFHLSSHWGQCEECLTWDWAGGCPENAVNAALVGLEQTSDAADGDAAFREACSKIISWLGAAESSRKVKVLADLLLEEAVNCERHAKNLAELEVEQNRTKGK